MPIVYKEDEGKQIDKVMQALDAIKRFQELKPEQIRKDKSLASALDKKRNDLKDPSEHFVKKSAAHRRLLASMPIEVNKEIKKRYGEDVFTDRKKFKEIMSRPENKMFLMDKI